MDRIDKAVCFCINMYVFPFQNPYSLHLSSLSYSIMIHGLMAMFFSRLDSYIFDCLVLLQSECFKVPEDSIIDES